MDFDRYCDDTLDLFRERRIGRRELLGRIGFAAMAVGVIGPALNPLRAYAQQVASIRYDGFGGASQKSMTEFVLDRFTAETGVKVNQGSFSGLTEFMAKVQLAPVGEYNIFHVGREEELLRFVQLDLVEPLDRSKIPGLDKLDPSVMASYNKLHADSLMGVPMSQSGIWIVYNKEKIPAAEVEEKGFNILLDPKYDQYRVGENDYLKRMYYAALQTKQNPNDIKDFDVLWEAVRESKPRTLKHYATNAEHVQLFASGEAWIADGRFLATNTLQRQGVPVEGWPRTGTFVTFAGLGALKGTPMDAFYKIISILLTPEVLIEYTHATGGAPVLDRTKVDLPATTLSAPGTYAAKSPEDIRVVDPVYWVENGTKFQREYTRVMARA